MVASTITKVTAPDIPIAVLTLFETPRKGHTPRNWARTMLLTSIAEIISKMYSISLSSLCFIDPVGDCYQIPEGDECSRRQHKYQDAVSFNELVSHYRSAAEYLPHGSQNAKGHGEPQSHAGTVNE